MDLILHEYYLSALANLSDSQFRKMILAMLEYAKTGNAPKFGDSSLSFGFEVIKKDIDKERKKHESRAEANRKNGAKGGRPCKNRDENCGQEKPKITQKTQWVSEITQNNPKNPVGFSETQWVSNEPSEAPVKSRDTQDLENTPKNPVGFSDSKKNPVGFCSSSSNNNNNNNILINNNNNNIITTTTARAREETQKTQWVFDDDWERAKKDIMWRSQVCMTHEIEMANLDKIIERFEADVKIKGLKIEKMRRYFGSWVGPNRNILNGNNLKTKRNGGTTNNRLEGGMLNKEYNLWGNKKPMG